MSIRSAPVLSWDLIGVGCVLVASQAVNVAVVRAIVRSEVSKLNGTYMRHNECALRHVDVDRRLDKIEDSV
jgi:hypothetical protein